MPPLSLEEFIQPIPVCEYTADLAAVLEIFSRGDCERLVVVNEQQHPLGVVKLQGIMPHLLIKNPSHEGKYLVAGMVFDLQQPLSQLGLPLIESLTTLPAQLSLSEFFPYLHSSAEATDSQWALIDSAGKLVGMLDSLRLLRFLATHPDGSGVNAPILTQSLKQARNSTKTPNAAFTLKPITQLLEQLPIPLRLQTDLGEILLQNLAWRQEVGEGVHLDLGQPKTTTVPDSLSSPLQELYAVGLEGQAKQVPQWWKRPDEATIGSGYSAECHCAAARVSYSKTEPLAAHHEALKWEAYIQAHKTHQQNQEHLWQFVKTPLQLSELTDQLNLGQVWLVLAQDVTEQQQVAKELAAKNADLIQLNRLKDEFLACISHELKTPLTSVLGLSTLLKDQVLGQLNERQARYAQLIHQSGRQLMTVVNDILDLTRMETGQMELMPDTVQILTVCECALEQAQQLQRVKNEGSTELESQKHLLDARFTLEIEPGLETIVADELRLRQMLTHLLSNALKFTETDGSLGLKVSHWDGWIAFNVWDTGIGIPADKQHLIFQKFQQLENPLTRRFDGTGLGLVLTQRLARLHGGDVSFISKEVEGSQFTLLLPPSPPHNPRFLDLDEGLTLGEKSASLSSDSTFHPKSLILNPKLSDRLVLIVEAVPQYIETLSHQLKTLGYRVVIARSGTEAIEKARRLNPVAILLNPILPQLSGWDVLTLLKSDDQTCQIPILVTATQAEKEQAIANRADGFLSLPVQEEALRQNLTRFSEPKKPIRTNLTILHLLPDFSVLGSEFNEAEGLNFDLNCRVIEADDLEQAELLARIWQPQVVLLDGSTLDDPLAYLQELSSHTRLASLPLVTLDHQTTEAANQVTSLSVFPCLAPAQKDKTAALLQVIQVAVGMSWKPSILVVGSPFGSDFQAQSTSGFDCSKAGGLYLSPYISPREARLYPTTNFQGRENNNCSPGAFLTCTDTPLEYKSSYNFSAPPWYNLQPSQEWRQALIQYLQTAGFKSTLSRSWTEVVPQLQHRSVDLLLIHLTDVEPQLALVEGLKSLAQLSVKPPILVLDHRYQGDQLRKSVYSDSSSQLETLLNTVATQILPNVPQSMDQLLEEINALLSI